MNNCGIIEGYFGRPWNFRTRGTYPEFLRQHGYSFFIYAPKNDPNLRKKWDRPWSSEYTRTLQNFARRCAGCGIKFGIGYTPAGDASAFASDPALLLERIRSIRDALPLDYFALLFDDLENHDRDRLAVCQLKIAELVATELSTQTRMIVCPSYYSTDPVLEKVFGARPANYWNEYAGGLDPAIDIFWTGEKVCSSSYCEEHLEWFEKQFRRKAFLWDNYPVNDGKKMADFLYLKPFTGRPSCLEHHIAGHAVNPMREPYLNRITMATLADSYRDTPLDAGGEQYWKLVCSITGRRLAAALREDFELFTQTGLSQIQPSGLEKLKHKYSSFRNSPYGREIYRYLCGEYAFDPACLTG